MADNGLDPSGSQSLHHQIPKRVFPEDFVAHLLGMYHRICTLLRYLEAVARADILDLRLSQARPRHGGSGRESNPPPDTEVPGQRF